MRPEVERSLSAHRGMRQLVVMSGLLLAALSAPAAPTDKQAWCAQYATRAVQQNQLLISHPTCHVIPSLRWQSVYNNHYAGCLSFPQSFMESEQRARDEDLHRCAIVMDSPSAQAPHVSNSASVPPDTAEATTSVTTSSPPSLPGVGHLVRILHTFSAPDGSAPVGALVEGPDGTFYGITSRDGQISGGNNSHNGTVFKVAPSGSYSNLHVFSRGPDGGEPTSLILGTDGNLYGATREGGALNGTIFKITPAGELTTLHAFNGTDGSHPLGLVQDRAGMLYGTTLSGTMFKITMSGEFSVLPMSGVNDCGNAALTPSPDGFLYAICAGGGAAFSGEIVKLSADGRAAQLHAFAGPDGRFPRSPLTLAKDGSFYGTTTSGGLNGLGTIFKISPQGTMTVIRHLSLADGASGAAPSAALLALSNGDLVGAGSSTIFELAPDGKLTTLYQLNNQSGEGVSPNAFVQGRDGVLYATTNKGGTHGMGTLLQLAPGKAGAAAVAAAAGSDGQKRTSPQKLMPLDALRTAGRAPGKFYLGGVWVVHARVASGQIIDTQYRFAQAGDEFHYCFKQAEVERCYIGTYPAHATQIRLKPDFQLPAQYSPEDLTLVIKDPDHVDTHLRVQGHELVLLYERISAPESDDAPCDPQNSSHTAANFAFERARASYHHNDTVAAACWNHTAAVQGYARSQGLLSAVLEVGEGVAENYSASYVWAKKSAEQGDFLGEIMLSRLYHFGHGVVADEDQSKVWRDKGMAGYRTFLQSMQGKGSAWDRLNPAQRSKVVRLTLAILDTWAGNSQQSAMLEDVKHDHPGISDAAARAMLRDDPDYQDAREMTSSGFDTQLRMVLGLDTADDGTSKKGDSRR